MPRGLALGSVSGIAGTPAKSEKRTVIGTVVPDWRCGALLSAAAPALGVNLPSNTIPLACTARLSVCLPNTPFSASTSSAGVDFWLGSLWAKAPVTVNRAIVRDNIRRGVFDMVRLLDLRSHYSPDVLLPS